MTALKIDRYDTRCALCRKDEAAKTGSHIVPSFLLQSMFSFDGKPKRGREISMRECLNQEGTSVFYGRDVKPEAIEIDHGAPLTDEELDIREQERTEGRLHCVQDERKRLDEARALDNMQGKPAYTFRNARRFQIARWKQYCAEQLGIEYDCLKDRTLFLFPYRLENYVHDLRKAAKAGCDVSHLPYVEKYLPDYQWKNKQGYASQMQLYEEMTKNATDRGMTLEDIIYRNCINWENK